MSTILEDPVETAMLLDYNERDVVGSGADILKMPKKYAYAFPEVRDTQFTSRSVALGSLIFLVPRSSPRQP